MKLSLNLLNKFITFNCSIEEIERKFTDKVAEIDSITQEWRWLEKVFIGQILEITTHPNADKMRVTQTKVWSDILQIVCWASNISVWIKVPVAVEWAILPNWFEIKSVDKRWVKSCWMICSEAELWLKESSEWIMELSSDAPIWEHFATWYWKNDVIFEIENTALTNRPDLFAHSSWAKEAIAIWIAKPVDNPEWTESSIKILWEVPHAPFPINISIEDDSLAPRIQSVFIKGVRNWPSPIWIQRILESVWIRPISLLVDATNLWMIISWVPMHVFDITKIKWAVKMRASNENELVTTLDWTLHKLWWNVIIMEDEQGIFDLCWIMWGKCSWVSEETEDVWIHVPVYDPVRIRRASIALKAKSEASSIYEKKVPVSQTSYALKCILKIILESSTTACIASSIFDHHTNKPWSKKIKIAKNKLISTLWIEISSNEIMNILASLSFEPVDLNTHFEVVAPPNRLKDIDIEEDLIEEIARVYGLQNIKSKPPILELKLANVPLWHTFESRMKDNLSMQGFFEVLNYSFYWSNLISRFWIKSESVELANPISEELSIMRTTLIPYLITELEKNRLYKEKFWLFELWRVFLKTQEVKAEERHLAFASLWYNFDEVKSVLDSLLSPFSITVQYIQSSNVNYYSHPWQCADLFFEWNQIWTLSALHPRVVSDFWLKGNQVYFFEINLELLINKSPKIKKYKAFSRFPTSKRDMNFILDRKEKVTDFIRKVSKSSPLIQKLKLKDVYEWEWIEGGKKSITFEVTYGSSDSTLKEEEVIVAHEAFINACLKLWAKLRE